MSGDETGLQELGVTRPEQRRLLMGVLKGEHSAAQRFMLLDRAKAEALVLACLGRGGEGEPPNSKGAQDTDGMDADDLQPSTQGTEVPVH